MAVTWHKTNFLGIRFREHATRKHGIRADRCFSIRYKLEGKDKEEVAGWSSEGMTAEKAFLTLSTIRENIRKGIEPRSILAIRQANELKAKDEQSINSQKEKEKITFSQFWETEYLPAIIITKTTGSIEAEKGLYNKWISPVIGNIPLQKLDTEKIEALMLHAQQSGKSPATIRYILAVISQVWNRAVVYNIVQGESPTRHIKKPRQDNRRTRFLTISEARLLLKTLAEHSIDIHDEALLSLFCGLRAGEIHNLTWGDIDLSEGTILIRDPKNRQNRHAFMTQKIYDMFKRRLNNSNKHSLIFPATNGKKRRWVSDTFSKTVDTLKFNDNVTDVRQKVVFHTLRHTFASWLVQKGTPLYTVAELMGHTTLEMTRRYSHLSPDSLRKATMSLENSLD